MTTVSIAELKKNLSTYLRKVRKGEEIIVKARNVPIARILPLPVDDYTAEDLELIASGQMRPPLERLDVEALLAIGADNPVDESVIEAAVRAIEQDRQERDDAVLGR